MVVKVRKKSNFAHIIIDKYINILNITEITIPLSLASQIDTLFKSSKNIKQITWVDQIITPHEERAVNVYFSELTQDNYTDGTAGWTIKFSLENNNNGSTIVSVVDIFLI